MLFPIVTKKEADKIINERDGIVHVSLDLGVSLTGVVKNSFVKFGDQKIPLSVLCKVKEKTCYIITNNILKPIAFFSDKTNLYYKLIPTKDWPTITLSSTPMHRHTKISPKIDTQLKIKEISPVNGVILDTCCGLGYTAILSSKKAINVFTFEKDKNIMRIAKFNPYSKDLFCSKNIKIYEKDIFNEITKFKDLFFDRIIHDPPTFKYSPELYSIEFHRELYRTLKKNGILYHYCPCPHKTKGRTFHPRIVKQLRDVGFKKVEYHTQSSGVRALKL